MEHAHKQYLILKQVQDIKHPAQKLFQIKAILTIFIAWLSIKYQLHLRSKVRHRAFLHLHVIIMPFT